MYTSTLEVLKENISLLSGFSINADNNELGKRSVGLFVQRFQQVSGRAGTY